MCTRPHLIPAPGITTYQRELYNGLPLRSGCMVVPCGKCPECMKRRSADIAARCTIEANARGSMTFLTLTYREEKLPIGLTFEQVCKATGEVVNRSWTDAVFSSRDKANSEILEYAHKNLSKVPAGPLPRIGCKLLFEDHEYGYYHSFTPSLCRDDVRLWLKSSRIAYLRKYDRKLNFSYIACGEYGPNTCRPHYHLALFGLTEFQAYYLAERWRERYGNYHISFISAVNPDGSNGYARTSRYIAKYVAKGFFECRSVCDGRAEKPRMCVSCRSGFGLGDSFLNERLISYFRCEDLFPGVDVNDGKSVSDLYLYTKEVLNRCILSFGDMSFPLPRKFIKKIWYYYDDIAETYLAFPLRFAMQNFIQDRVFRDYLKRFKDSPPELFGSGYLTVCSELGLPEDITPDELRHYQELSGFYKKSIY